MLHFYSRIAYLGGFFFGVICAYLILSPQHDFHNNAKTSLHYNTWLSRRGIKRQPLLWDTIRYSNQTFTTEAQYLQETIQIICIVLVKNHKNAEAASNTWGKGCNKMKLVYLSNKKKMMPAKRTKETSSWMQLCDTLTKLEENFDWVLILKDDTFAIMENLRYFVATLNSTERYYLGHPVLFWSTKYNSGEAGYVISRGTVKALNSKLMNDCSTTNAYWNREDFYLGKHLASLNITTADTKDSEGLSTFFPYNWFHVFFPGESYYKTSLYPTKCCSKNAITFQAIEGDKMYFYYYILYTLQLFKFGTLGNRAPRKLRPDDEVWKEFLRERNVPVEGISMEAYYKVWEDLVHDPESFARDMKKEQHFDYDVN